MSLWGVVTEPFSFRRAARDTAGVVWLTTVFWTLLLLVWSVVVPMFNGADEPQHIDISLDAAEMPLTGWFAADASNTMSERLGQISRSLGYFDEASIADPVAPLGRSSGQRTLEQAPPRDTRLTFDGLDGPANPQFGRVNQMTQHPPLYYRLQGLLITSWPGWEQQPADLVIAVMRVLSVIVVSPLPLLAAWTIRGLGFDRTTEAVAALGIVAVPQFAHLGSVVTNDSLLIGTGALVTLLLAHVATGDLSRRTAARVGVATLLAMLTKGVALVLPAAVLVAYWRGARIGAAPEGVSLATRLSRSWQPLAIAGGISSLALVWYVENALRFGSLQPSILAPVPPAEQGPLALFLSRAFEVQTRTFWGRTGWVETGVDTPTATIATVILLVLLAIGSVRLRTALSTVLLSPAVLAVAAVWYESYKVFGEPFGIRAVAGRYAAAGFLGIVVVAAIGIRRVLPQRLAPVVTLLTAAGFQGLVMAVSLVWFYGTPPQVTGPGTVQAAAQAMLAWAPWSPALVRGLVLITAGVGVLLVVAVLRTVTTPGGGEQEDHQRQEQREDIPA